MILLLKRHTKELENLNRILELIRNSNDFLEFFNNPITKMYGIERLKHHLNKFYSINLSKRGGVIRLIMQPKENMLILELDYISYKHYEDFNEEKVIYYEKK